jgi:anti-sigma regulatory factor (Ser/Thr protein kinase)
VRSTARHAVRDLLQRDGTMAPEGVDDVLLLVSELVTNVVLHARTTIRVWTHVEPGRVIVAVGDDDPTNPPQWATRGPLAQSGRGMRLVDLLSSSWGVEVRDGSKVVWFEMKYEPTVIDLRSS